MILSAAVAIVSALFASACNCQSIGDGNDNEGLLDTVMIIEIYAAGSRAPQLKNRLDESWIDEVGLGRLTANGMRQQFNLGLQVRTKFLTFFELILSEEYIKVFSSGRSRSLISAISHNHGLFSPCTRIKPSENELKLLEKVGPQWSGKKDASRDNSLREEFFSEPVTVSVDTADQEEDFMFLPRMDISCPPAKDNRDHLRDYFFQQFDETIYPKIKELKEVVLVSEGKTTVELGKLLENLDFNYSNILQVLEVVWMSYYEKGELPKGISQKQFETLKTLASAYFMAKFNEENIIKLYTSYIAKVIIKEIQNSIKSDLKKRKGEESRYAESYMYLGFSGDDDAVASYLTLFGATSSACLLSKLKPQTREFRGHNEEECYEIPPPSSSLIFQVYKSKDKGDAYSVKVLYNFKEIKITNPPFSGRVDPYQGDLDSQKFIKYLNDYALLDDEVFEVICGNRRTEILKKGSYTFVIALIVFLIVIVRRRVLLYSQKEKEFQDKMK